MQEKILHIMWNMNIGGAERAVYQLIREQRRSGMDSNVLIANSIGYYGELIKKTGANVHFLGMKSAKDFSIKEKYLEITSQYKIIHFQTAEPFLMFLSAKQKNNYLYYTHRGGMYKYSITKRLKNEISGYLLRNFFKGISGNTNAGAYAASNLYRIPIKNVYTTYNGLDFSLLIISKNIKEVALEFGFQDDDIVLGTSANLRKWKRIDKLIEVFSKINNSKVKLLIIGDGPEKASLEKLANTFKGQQRIFFTGKKENVSDYLQLINIFVLPSESLESFGNSAVEAMALGITTIVMKDGGGLVEHIIDKETGFIANDFDNLYDIINKLTNCISYCSVIGEKSKIYIREKYSLQNMMRLYNQFYNSN